MSRHLVFICLLGLLTPTLWASPQRSIAGYVYEQGTQKPLVGVTVHNPDQKTGTSTDEQGHFVLTVPATQTIQLTFSFVGFTSVTQTVALNQNTDINVFLVAGQTLNEQVVKASRNGSEVANPQMSTISLSKEQLGKMPSLLGEKDVMRMLRLMPGVQKGSESNSGIYVRGGSPDQNLILLDQAPIYNPNHLLGFFSAFNGDVLSRVDLTKCGFPARFGGRLSSVIELTTQDGATDKLHGEASIGLVASRVTLRGPLSKKVSYMIAGRRTYLDLVTGLLLPSTTDQPALKTFFYDLNAKITVDAGPNDKLYISGYTSRDKFTNVRTDGMPLRSTLAWTNGAGSFRWNHRTSATSTTDLSLIYSQYLTGVQDQQTASENAQTGFYTLNYQSAIQDLGLKYEVNQYINNRHQLRFGGQVTHRRFDPKAYVQSGLSDAQRPTNDQVVNAVEAGAYLEHVWNPTNQLHISSGLRISAYSVLENAQATATTPTYIRPEPRLSMAYEVSPTLSLKGSYALMNQYVHMLSSTGIGLSTDLWVPTVQQVSPQQSQQFAVGMVKALPKSGLTFTVEGYYKQMHHLLSYREGASFLSTDSQGNLTSSNWVDNVTSGQGWSYGTELMLQKRTGRFTGWIGYTLSWTKWQFEELNNGNPFFPRYDRRHDASIVGMYELSPSITLSGSWVYGTGNALMLPLSRYSGYADLKTTNTATSANALYGSGANVKEYGEQNSFRAEAYHRLDVSLRFLKKRANSERVWELSIYNVYNRRNAFMYSLEGKSQGANLPSKTVLYKYSLFPVVPSVSYTIRF